MKEKLYDKIESNRGNTQRSPWFRDAARMKLEIEDAAEAAGVDTDDLPENWWQDFLYSAARDHFDGRREERAADERERDDREIEAD